MGKSLLYRLFGIGKTPEPVLAQFKQEGILFSDEGLKGSVTYHDFSAPGKRFLWKRAGLMAALILTNTRLVALSGPNPLINIPYTDERIRGLHWSLEDEEKLLVAFDAGLFHPDWSGKIEYRFRTPEAKRFLDLLNARIA